MRGLIVAPTGDPAHQGEGTCAQSDPCADGIAVAPYSPAPKGLATVYQEDIRQAIAIEIEKANAAPPVVDSAK